MAIEKTQGILLGSSNGAQVGALSPKAYGGYIFSAHYSINFTQPSKLTLSIVSEDGNYDEEGLADRIFPQQRGQEGIVPTRGGAITCDTIVFGGKTFLMHPLKYSINQGPQGRFLQIDYYDRSIAFLDKVLVLLRERDVPPTYDPIWPLGGGLVLGSQPNIIAIGNPYIPARGSATGAPGIPDGSSDNSKLPTYLYNPIELYDGMLNCPALAGRLGPSCSLLVDYAVMYGATTDPESSKLLKGHAGTLRQVLNRWAEDLGFIFYWEPTTDKLGLMDLRAPLHFNAIQNTVGLALSARNIVEKTWSYSIEETFSKGVAAYYGRDGEAGEKTTKITLRDLDLLTVNIHRCFSSSKTQKACENSGDDGDVWNEVDYCNNAKTWSSLEMKDIREKDDRLISYIRLLKAAAIGPEFYKIYVIHKKLASHEQKFPDWGGLGDGENPGQPLAAEGRIGKNKKDTAVGLAGLPEDFWNGQKFKLGDIGPPGGLDDDKKNPIVDDLYYSAERESFNEILWCYSESEDGSHEVSDASYIIGKDCLSVEMLNIDKLPQYSQVNQLYKFVDQRLINTTSNSSEKPVSKPGQYVICRMKKYGIRSFSTNSTDDHIYGVLRGIALNQGRFLYSTSLKTAKQFSKQKYAVDGIQWIDRAVDVNDTPLGELYHALNPTSSLASVPMPNGCVEHKNGNSKEEKCGGGRFDDPPNTARPTIEQFIQSVFGDTVVDQTEGRSASLSVSLNNSQVGSISIDDGGEGYLNGGDGTLAGAIQDDQGSGAEFEAEIVGGVVVSINIISGGTGYSPSVTATVPGNTDISTDTNVFGADVEKFGEENQDSILAQNLAERNKECMKDCEKNKEIENRKGVILLDTGAYMKIPNRIQERIERHVNAFSPLPTNSNISMITYHNEAGYQLFALASPIDLETIKESEEYSDWFDAAEKAGNAPKDELDFIVDQVEIPNLTKAVTSSRGINATVSEMGDKFEANAFVRPIYESNVRELVVDFVSPSEKDLGVKDADCQQSLDPKEMEKKRKKDKKLVEDNIYFFAQSLAFQQDRVEYNSQITVADSVLQDESNSLIDLLVENGLESMNARVSEEGVKLTYSVGTRRKRRVINKPFEDMWMKVKPEFYNTIFDI